MQFELNLRHFCTTKLVQDIAVQVRIGPGQNRHRNELILLYSALIKKRICCEVNSFAFMVTRYFGNMIAFLLCHYTYLSITTTSKLSALNHNKILYSPAASTHSLIFFGSCENKLCHYKQSFDMRCITPGIVQCRLCENITLLAINQLRKITFH